MKFRTQYVCQQCNYSSPKWLGKCTDCGAWNSFVEDVVTEGKPTKNPRGLGFSSPPIPITKISSSDTPRMQLSSDEFNRVLGGGLTRGSVVLLSGDPGIGKSTLLLQMVGNEASKIQKPILYISGEESAQQIQYRAERLKVLHHNLQVLSETNLMEISKHLDDFKPEIVVVDSVQTLYWPELESIPGSIGQVREVADRLVRYAKQRGSTIFLVGHVNKEGGIAGPMTLEHLVDTVLFLEGERGGQFRILRAIKNRFGATDEIGVFSMQENGMEEVTNPSELFLKDRPQNTPGTVVFPAMEGTRPLLVEVQGLSTRSSYGVPMRNSVGFEKNRLMLLLAVLEKRAGFNFSDQDVYLNVVGGIRLSEPAADLAVAAAVLSSYLGKIFPPDAVLFGEVGLSGEIRNVSSREIRIREANKLGFKKTIDRSSLKSINQMVEFLR